MKSCFVHTFCHFYHKIDIARLLTKQTLKRTFGKNKLKKLPSIH